MNRLLVVLLIISKANILSAQADTTYFYEQGLKAIGQFDIKGKEHGLWTNFYLTDTIQSKGKYNHGIPTGFWANYDSLGRKINEGSYEDGLKTGVWKEWDYFRKEYRESGFKRDTIHGKTAWIHFDGY
ncbi:toxin-antitoxin system YwqK family antitoxin, partial [Fulvivirga kasyanovii]|nr:hypothetical protein [Fulvivirga kasyanovii]